MEIETGREKRS